MEIHLGNYLTDRYGVLPDAKILAAAAKLKSPEAKLELAAKLVVRASDKMSSTAFPKDRPPKVAEDARRLYFTAVEIILNMPKAERQHLSDHKDYLHVGGASVARSLGFYEAYKESDSDASHLGMAGSVAMGINYLALAGNALLEKRKSM